MKERPILFSTQMVRAILDGKKTQTRRVVKPQPNTSWMHTYTPFSGATYNGNDAKPDECDGLWYWAVPGASTGNWRCPYGQPSDQLWVRETWQHSNYPHGPLQDGCDIFYRADYWDDPHGMDGEKSQEGKYRDWKPSTHMPRWASRIQLEIIKVRVERLQDISEADANAEGCIASSRRISCDEDYITTARDAYCDLWESINGSGSWNANPWVWVIEFKVVDTLNQRA